jgi:maltooligosyltrehalose trehalohydrolase
VPPRAFIHCIQNHDQVGNRALGDRLHEAVPAPLYRALSAMLLLSPYTPLIWMGQEWCATSPFRFFTDVSDDIGKQATAGRLQEFADFAAFKDSSHRARVPDPQHEATFLDSRLCWVERDRDPHRGILALYKTLLAMRRTFSPLRRRDRASFCVVALSDSALAIRREGADGSAMLVAAQLRPGTYALSCSHSLFAHAPETCWSVALWSEDERFGGRGGHAGSTNMDAVVLNGVGALVLSTVPIAQRRGRNTNS